LGEPEASSKDQTFFLSPFLQTKALRAQLAELQSRIDATSAARPSAASAGVAHSQVNDTGKSPAVASASQVLSDPWAADYSACGAVPAPYCPSNGHNVACMARRGELPASFRPVPVSNPVFSAPEAPLAPAQAVARESPAQPAAASDSAPQPVAPRRPPQARSSPLPAAPLAPQVGNLMNLVVRMADLQAETMRLLATCATGQPAPTAAAATDSAPEPALSDADLPDLIPSLLNAPVVGSPPEGQHQQSLRTDVPLVTSCLDLPEDQSPSTPSNCKQHELSLPSASDVFEFGATLHALAANSVSLFSPRELQEFNSLNDALLYFPNNLPAAEGLSVWCGKRKLSFANAMLDSGAGVVLISEDYCRANCLAVDASPIRMNNATGNDAHAIGYLLSPLTLTLCKGTKDEVAITVGAPSFAFLCAYTPCDPPTCPRLPPHPHTLRVP